MKQIVKIGSVALLSAFLMIGCSSKEGSATAAEVDAKHIDMIHVENVTSEQLYRAIMAAGETEGWKMTKFKSNEVIAEKFGEDEATATINFDKHGYQVHAESGAGDLEDAIAEQLKATASH